jgi:hypothetical protein
VLERSEVYPSNAAEELLYAGRVSKRVFHSGYRDLILQAKNARDGQELQKVKDTWQSIDRKLYAAPAWRSEVEKYRPKLAEAIRKRSDELRKTGSSLEVGGTASIPGVGGGGVKVKKATTQEPALG